MTKIIKQFDHIKQRIKQACLLNEQTIKHPVTLLAVSKRHPIKKIQSLYELGQRHFGESYLQEALKKIDELSNLNIIWHFIGPIQSNKTKQIAQNFDWVHSVDRLKIASRLSRQRPSELPALNICLQINISEEAQKSGFSSTEIHHVIKEISSLPNIIVRGLMAIPAAIVESPQLIKSHQLTKSPQLTDSLEQLSQLSQLSQQRLAFKQLNMLMQQLNKQYHLNMDTLSMGMSNDLEAAIAEGATIVRIGTALFGSREN